MPTFNYRQFQCLRQIPLPLNSVTGEEEKFSSFHMTPDWRYLITMSYLMVNNQRSLPEIMRFWDWRTGEVERRVEVFIPFFSPHLITPDGQYAIGKAEENRVEIWSLQTGEPVRQLSGHRGMVGRIAVSPDGNTIATSGWDQNASYRDIPVDGPGTTIAEDRTIMLWDWQNGKLLRTLNTEAENILVLRFHPDGQTLFSAHNYGSSQQRHKSGWRVWNWQTGELLKAFPNIPTNLFGMSRDGSAIVTDFYQEPADGQKAFRVWDASTGEPIQTFRASHTLKWICFSPDDRLLLARYSYPRPDKAMYRMGTPEYDAVMQQWKQDTSRIEIWSVETGQVVGELTQPHGIEQIYLSPDGCNLAVKTEHTIEIWGIPPG